jgi:hypothetical protein
MVTARDVLGYIVSGSGLGGSAAGLGVAATGLFLLFKLFRGVMLDAHVESLRPTVPPTLPPIMAEIMTTETTTVTHNALRDIRNTMTELSDSTRVGDLGKFDSTVCGVFSSSECGICCGRVELGSTSSVA